MANRKSGRGLRRARPWGSAGMVHPDTGEAVESLPARAEMYDPATGRLLATFVDPTPEAVAVWSHRRPVGSTYRAVVRGGARIFLRLDVTVLPDGLVEIERKGGKP